ncbi:gamma-glutamyltranspeptidase family protein, partial [Striga asiatica]
SLPLGLSFAIFFLLEFLVSNPKIALARKGQKVIARHGIVATDETECSKIGRVILQRGGHAVDAAVGAALCLGVVSPSFNGLEEMLVRDLSKWKTGPLSIAVPEQLDGLYTAHRKYGKLLWESIVRPVENLARDGFNVSESFFMSLSHAKSVVMADKELRRTFAPNGELLFLPKLVQMTKLANTLEAIAKWGMNIFYNGSMGETLAKEIQKFGGIITKEDFQKYRVVQRRPLVARVMGYELVTVPPPASARKFVFFYVVFFDATSIPMSLAMHRLVEALKYALARRMDLGDPAFVNVTCVLKNMISTRYARKLKNLIYDNKTFDPVHYGGVRCTITGQLIFVSWMINDGKVKAVIGAAGGLLIPDAVTQVLMNHLKYRMDTSSAVKAARFYHKLNPNVLYLENYRSRFGDYYGYNSSIQAELRQKGHVLEGACRWPSCQLVIQMFKGANAGKLVAVTDPRKGGLLAGNEESDCLEAGCLLFSPFRTLNKALNDMMENITEGKYLSPSAFCLFLLLLFSSSLKTAHASVDGSVVARRGVVATDETLCSIIGRAALYQGGHAVDAAVASAFCLGVISPSYSGIGGGGFMLVRSSDGKSEVYDMREMAPQRASKDMFRSDYAKQQIGPLSIAVPGQVAGLYKAHSKYGKLKWESLVKPAENLARNGFNISDSFFRSLKGSEQFILADQGLRAIFAPKGKLLPLGSTVRLVKLANTLAAISKNGPNAFYNGPIARSLAGDIQAAGGIVTPEDFQRYRVLIRSPLVANTMGYQFVTAPPPASGGAVMILILKILSNYNMAGVHITLVIHRLIEALKFALALRTNFGDPDFVNVTSTLTTMISTSHAQKLKSLINDNKTFDPAHYGSKWGQVYDHGTTHACVVDGKRNVVSMTMSLNSHFGSKFVSPSTGIFLNNQMYDFSIPNRGTPPPSPANFIQPYKRPLSSMAPTIILKARNSHLKYIPLFVYGTQVKAVIGAAGGLMIPNAVTEVLVNYLHLRINPLDAVLAPRFYHMLYPNVLYHEEYSSAGSDKYSCGPEILKSLKNKGHVLQKGHGWTICQFVVQKLEGPNSGQLLAVTDQRKGGSAVGY